MEEEVTGESLDLKAAEARVGMVIKDANIVIKKVAGMGGMAVVYQGLLTDMSGTKTVAVKVMRTSLVQQGGDSVKRFLREAGALMKLDHPNIIPTLGSGMLEDGCPYFVMPFIQSSRRRSSTPEGPVTSTPDGGAEHPTSKPDAGVTSVVDLERLLKDYQSKGQAIPVSLMLALALPIAEALEAAHAEGIAHRDVKPSNVLLKPKASGYHVYLTDFGLVKDDGGQGENKTKLTSAGKPAGTPAYMSPEQANDASTADRRTDIYSLGAMLFECLSGRPVFEGGWGEVMASHIFKPPPDLAGLMPPDFPPAVASFVMGMLIKKREDRQPQTMSEVVRCLALLQGIALTSHPVMAPAIVAPPALVDGSISPSVSQVHGIHPGGRRRRLAVVALIVAAFLLPMGIIVWKLTRPREVVQAARPQPTVVTPPPQVLEPPPQVTPPPVQPPPQVVVPVVVAPAEPPATGRRGSHHRNRQGSSRRERPPRRRCVGDDGFETDCP